MGKHSFGAWSRDASSFSQPFWLVADYAKRGQFFRVRNPDISRIASGMPIRIIYPGYFAPSRGP